MRVQREGGNPPQVQARGLYNSFETKRALVISGIVAGCMYIVPPFFHRAQRLSSCVISGALFGVAYRGVFALLNFAPLSYVTQNESTQHKIRVVASLLLSGGVVAYQFWRATTWSHTLQMMEEVTATCPPDAICIYENPHHVQELRGMLATFLGSAFAYLLARIPLAPNPYP